MSHEPKYSSDAKAEWRNIIYKTLNEDTNYCLTDQDNNLPWKWLEPIGEDAIPFRQLLDTGRIQENQLIGIDLDPKFEERSKQNIENCKKIYPEAEFACKSWKDYCSRYKNTDIGYFIFDLYYSTSGKPIVSDLKATLPLIEACKDNIGEVLFVINTDYGHQKRFRETGKQTLVDTVLEVLRTSENPEIRNMQIVDRNVYTYKNGPRSHEMASLFLIL